MTDKPPFQTVYLHGLIRTADGEKMSKSRPDKVVDPLDLIATYGTDALRFFLITAGSPGGDIKVDVKIVAGRKQVDRIEGARNFANKLWNAVRYVLGKVEAWSPQPASGTPEATETGYSLSDRWILARCSEVIHEVRALMDGFQYNEAGRVLYDFAWGDVCDWYLELSKLQNTPQTVETLVRTTDLVLRMLHPYMPYVTEELWQHLKQAALKLAQRDPALALPDFDYPAVMMAAYPIVELDPTEAAYASALREMPPLQEVIRSIRNARAEYKVAVERHIPALINAGQQADAFNTQRKVIAALARVDDSRLTIAETLPVPSDKCVTLVMNEATVYLPLSGLVDLDQERQRLQAELDDLGKVIARSETLLQGDFARRAPAALVEKERVKLADATSRREQIQQRLSQLQDS